MTRRGPGGVRPLGREPGDILIVYCFDQGERAIGKWLPGTFAAHYGEFSVSNATSASLLCRNAHVGPKGLAGVPS
jgi:hypothetical protein